MISVSLFSMKVTLDKELWLDEQHLCWDRTAVAPLSVCLANCSPLKKGRLAEGGENHSLLSVAILSD